MFELMSEEICRVMFDNEEMWYVLDNGYAVMINDASLIDC